MFKFIQTLMRFAFRRKTKMYLYCLKINIVFGDFYLQSRHHMFQKCSTAPQKKKTSMCKRFKLCAFEAVPKSSTSMESGFQGKYCHISELKKITGQLFAVERKQHEKAKKKLILHSQTKHFDCYCRSLCAGEIY